MVFFTDACFPERGNQLLEVFDRDNQIRGFASRFEKTALDVVWIPEVATWKPKPIVISGDARILRNKVERAVLREAQLVWVCLTDGWMNLDWYENQAWKLIKAWPRVVDAVKAVTIPTVFELSASTLKIQRRIMP